MVTIGDKGVLQCNADEVFSSSKYRLFFQHDDLPVFSVRINQAPVFVQSVMFVL